MRALIVVAWALFLVDVIGLSWLLWGELSGFDPLSRSIGLGIAKLMAPPFAALLAALALSTWFRSRIGLWICLALAVAPIILVASNIVRHSA